MGAAAEIKEKSVFKKTYSLDFEMENFPKAEERKLKMWFKTKYGVLAEKYTMEHVEFRLKFGENGQLVAAEIFNGTHWIPELEILKAFKNLNIAPLQTKKQFTIIVRDSRSSCDC